jgi:hypothetical protein
MPRGTIDERGLTTGSMNRLAPEIINLYLKFIQLNKISIYIITLLNHFSFVNHFQLWVK